MPEHNSTTIPAIITVSDDDSTSVVFLAAEHKMLGRAW